MDNDVGAVAGPVLLWAPPTREFVDTSGVENVKLADVAVPAKSPEIAA